MIRRSSLPLVAALVSLAGAAAAADGDAAPANEAARLDALELQVKALSQKLAEAPAAKGGSSSVKAGGDGFTMLSDDGQYSLKLGGYVQAATKIYLTDEDQPAANSMFIKRARLIVDGVLGEHVAFRIMPDFGTGNTLLQDAYAQLRLVPEAVVQVGKFKQPTGLERLQSDATLLFIERSLATQLTPDRDEGVQLGGLLGGRVEYAVGVFNGGVDNGARDGDTNDNKEGAARVFAQPFKGDGAMISGIGFGIGGTFGSDNGTPAAPALPSYKTSGESVPGGTAVFFTYKRGAVPTAANTAVAAGWKWRVIPQGYWYAGPFHLQGEYATSAQGVAFAGTKQYLVNRAWDAEVGWVITGDDASYTGVKPKHPFSLKSGTWGAWEIGFRASRLDVDSDAFAPVTGPADPSKAARAATSYGAALNWYLTRNLKLQTDYEFTRFDQGAGATAATARDLQSENVIESQLQVSF